MATMADDPSSSYERHSHKRRKPPGKEGGILALAIDRYLQQLQKKPLRTKALTSSALAALSDLIAQRIVGKGPLNWRRTGALAVFGLVWSGPSAHYWQQLTERLFSGKRDGSTVIVRILLDQLTYGPLCTALYMGFVALVVEGRSWDFTMQKLYNDYLGVQRAGWRVWPLVSLINYKYVPLRLRVLVINIVALFWSTFLNLQSRTSVITWQR